MRFFLYFLRNAEQLAATFLNEQNQAKAKDVSAIQF